MKIIVTGGAGFIASHIVDAYIKKGHSVAVIDNLATGFRHNVNKKARFYEADIRDREAMERIFKKEKPEVVSHHAAIAEVMKSLRNPLPTLEVNVLGTTNVLLAFGMYGAGSHRKFIFSSTGGAIYGEPKKIPADENTPPLPLSPYGLSKALGEDVIKFYARQYKFPYVIFRYPNVYGPRQNPHGEAGVVAIFGGLLRDGKQPTIFGDGTKSRDYTFVADIVHANELALTKRTANNQTMNLGHGKIVSDKNVFDTIAKELNFSGEVKFAPHREGEVYKISLNASRAKKLLGWKPTVTFPEGVKRAVNS